MNPVDPKPVPTAATISLLHELLSSLGFSDTVESFQRELQARAGPRAATPPEPVAETTGEDHPTTAAQGVHQQNQSPSSIASVTEVAEFSRGTAPHGPQHVDPHVEVDGHSPDTEAAQCEGDDDVLEALLESHSDQWPAHIRAAGGWWEGSATDNHKVQYASSALEAVARCITAVPAAVDELPTALEHFAGALTALFTSSTHRDEAPLVAICICFARMQWRQLLLAEDALAVDVGLASTDPPVSALVSAIMALQGEVQALVCLTATLSSADVASGGHTAETPSRIDTLEAAHFAEAVQRALPLWQSRANALESWILHRSALHGMETTNHGVSRVPAEPAWQSLVSEMAHVLASFSSPTAAAELGGAREMERTATKQTVVGTSLDAAARETLRSLRTVCRVRLLMWAVVSITECVLTTTTPTATLGPAAGDSSASEVASTRRLQALSCMGVVLAAWATLCLRHIPASVMEDVGTTGSRGDGPVAALRQHLSLTRARLLLSLRAHPLIRQPSSAVELEASLCEVLHDACGSAVIAAVRPPVEACASSSLRPHQIQQRRDVLCRSIALGQLSSRTLSRLRRIESEEHTSTSIDRTGKVSDNEVQWGCEPLSRREQIQCALAQQRTLLELQDHPLKFATSVQLALLDSRARRAGGSRPADMIPAQHTSSSTFMAPETAAEQVHADQPLSRTDELPLPTETADQGAGVTSDAAATESLSDAVEGVMDEESVVSMDTSSTIDEEEASQEEEEGEGDEDEEASVSEYSSADDCFDSPEDALKEEVQQVRVSPCRGLLALLTTRGRLAVYTLKACGGAASEGGETLVLDVVLPDLPRHPRWFTPCDTSLAFSPDSRFLVASVQFQPAVWGADEPEAPYMPDATGTVCLFSLHAGAQVDPREETSQVWCTGASADRLYASYRIADMPLQETQWLDTRFWRSPSAVLRRHAQTAAPPRDVTPTRQLEHEQVQRLWRRYAVDGTLTGEKAAWYLSACAHLAAFQCLSSTRGDEIYRWEPASGVVLQCITTRASIQGFVFSALMGGVYVIDSDGNLLLINAAREVGSVSYNDVQGEASVVEVGNRGLPESSRLLMTEEETAAEADLLSKNSLADKALPGATFTGQRTVRFRQAQAVWESATTPTRRSTDMASVAADTITATTGADLAPLVLPLPRTVVRTLRRTGSVARAVASRGAERVGRLLLRRRPSPHRALARAPTTVVIDPDGDKEVTEPTMGTHPQRPGSRSESPTDGDEEEDDEASLSTAVADVLDSPRGLDSEGEEEAGSFWFFPARTVATAAAPTTGRHHARRSSQRRRHRCQHTSPCARARSRPSPMRGASVRFVTPPAVWYMADACLVFTDVGPSLCRAGGIQKLRHDPRIGVGGPLYSLVSLQLSGEPRWDSASPSHDDATAQARRRFARRCVETHITTTIEWITQWRGGSQGGAPPARALAELKRDALAVSYLADVHHRQGAQAADGLATATTSEKARPQQTTANTTVVVREVSATGLVPSSANGRYLAVMAAVGPYRQYTSHASPLTYCPGLYACLIFDTFHSHVVRVIPVCPTLPSPASPFTANAVIPTHEEAVKQPIYCLPCSLTTLDEEMVVLTVGGLAHQLFVFHALSGDRLTVTTLNAPARFVESVLAELEGCPPTHVATEDACKTEAHDDDDDVGTRVKPPDSVCVDDLVDAIGKWAPSGCGTARLRRGVCASVEGTTDEDGDDCLVPDNSSGNSGSEAKGTSADEPDGLSASTVFIKAATHALRAAEDGDDQRASTSGADGIPLVSLATAAAHDGCESSSVSAASHLAGEEMGQAAASALLRETDLAHLTSVATSASHEARRRAVLEALCGVCPLPVIWEAYQLLLAVAPLSVIAHAGSRDGTGDTSGAEEVTLFDGVGRVSKGATRGAARQWGKLFSPLCIATAADSPRTTNAAAPERAHQQPSYATGGMPFPEPAFSELGFDAFEIVHMHAAQYLNASARAASTTQPSSTDEEEVEENEEGWYELSAPAIRRIAAREAGVYNHQDQLRVGVVNCVASWCEPVTVSQATRMRFMIAAGTELGHFALVGGVLEPSHAR